MALLEQYGNDKAQDYDCPKYVAESDSKRCRHYLKGGACALASEFMCVLWLRANGHPVPDEHPVVPTPQKDLFGNPVPEPPPPKPKPSVTKQTSSAPSAPTPSADEIEKLERIHQDDIESFKALGVEVCMTSEGIGEVWLVPEYTGKDRKELSIEDAATLRLVVDAFPGATVTAFNKMIKGSLPNANKEPA